MNGLFIDPVRLPIGQFEIDLERIPETAYNNKKKRMELVCDPNYVNDIICILKHHFGENPENLFNNDSNLEAISNLNDMLNKALKWKEIGILGEYDIQNRMINYYLPDTYREIVEIHERYHALHHLMKDDDKNIWENFGDVPSFYQELLAQLFTWNYINNFRQDLVQPFLELNKNQPFIYQTWRIFDGWSPRMIEDLYWRIRELIIRDQPLGGLYSISMLIPINNQQRIIPMTKLRAFYESLSKLHFSTKTQLDLVIDINREKNYQSLVKLYNVSKNHFANKYPYNVEPFISKSTRKQLPSPSNLITSTNNVISIFDNVKAPICVELQSHYNFEYIDREISTLRTTNAIFEDGTPGKPSGGGGLDFIGWNIQKDLPILGEIKIKSDQNPFYAVIQLLTYLSELSTPNQMCRMVNTDLFKGHSQKNTFKSFYLYVILSGYDLRRKTNPSVKQDIKVEILDETKKLAMNLQREIPEIEEIVFLNLDTSSNIITKI